MTRQPAGPVFEFGPFRFESGNHLLLRGNEVIQLAPKAIDTLRLLLEQQGRVIGKQELIDRLWPDTSVESANLTQNIYLLRKALGEGPHDQTYIETIPKRGYRFVAPVTAKAAPDDARSDIRSSMTKPARLAGVLAAVLILGLVYARPWSRPASSNAIGGVRSIVVLPFKPIGLESRDEVLELGMADTLITKLGSIRQVIARPTSAVRRYSGLEQDPLAAGREQKADLVLEGSIQRVGERIRVTVRLLDVRDGTALMGETFDEPASDVFAAQDSIAERVLQSLTLKITDEEKTQLNRRYTANAETFRLYLKGRYFWDKRTIEGFQKAVGSFQEAIARDAQNPLPYVGLADAYIALPFDTDARPSDALSKAKAA